MISWSILGLALVPALILNTVVANVFLATAVVGALSCLILFGMLLRVMVRSASIESAGEPTK